MLRTSDNFPDGTLVKNVAGGMEALKQILFRLRKFQFSGYLKSMIKREGRVSEGYLIVKEGLPLAAVYGRRSGTGFEITKEGEDALKLFWADSYGESCEIEVRGRVDVDMLLGQHPNARIDLAEAAGAVKKKAKFTLAWGKDAERREEETKRTAELDALRKRMEEWHSAGYLVKILEESLSEGLDSARQQFEQFEKNVKQIGFLRDELSKMETPGFEVETERIKAMLRNPMKITAIEAALEDLKLAKEKKEAGGQAPLMDAEPLAGAGSIFPVFMKRMERCTVCGSDMAGRESCPTCGAGKQDAIIRKPEKELSQRLAAKGSNLIAEFTFDSFVIGECNRFSHSAALAVARGQSTINPLLIWSGAGLGKTHLLNAIGNAALENFEDKKVIYLTTERFVEEFREASKSNKIGAFRDKYRNVDFLLLDDIQFITEDEKAQDELFHTFNELYNNKKYIVMTCDRQIDDIQGLKERLVSRFEGGLPIEIRSPDFPTRMAILKKKLESAKLAVGEDVQYFIAQRYTKNIRKLEGALGTVITYSELMKKQPSVATAADALKDDTPDAPEGLELVPAAPFEPKLEKLKVGHSYIIEEEKPVKCFVLFVDNLNLGFRGMALTRMNPKRVNELYNVGSAAVLWLTDREGDPETSVPPVLEKIIYRIENLLNTPGKSVLMIDGFDYLVSNNNFDSVLRFLRRLIDEVSESQTIFIMSITPETIADNELKILEREMEIIPLM